MPLFSTPFAKRAAQPSGTTEASGSPTRRDGSGSADESAKSSSRAGSVGKLFWNLGSGRSITGVKLPQIGALNAEKQARTGYSCTSPSSGTAEHDGPRHQAARAAEAQALPLAAARAGQEPSAEAGAAPARQGEEEREEVAHRRPQGLGDPQNSSASMCEMKAHMLSDARVQDEVIPSVCAILELTVAAHPEAEVETVPGLEVFDGSTTPVSITAYVQRILKYSSCSTCNLVIGLMYLERLKTRHRKLKLTKVNIQRLLLVAVMTASKFFDDFYHNNQQWALIGGIGLSELNVLELDFLFLMTFDLNVKRDEYKSFVRKILVLGNGTPEKEEKPSLDVRRLASTPAPAAEKETKVLRKHATIDLPSQPSIANHIATSGAKDKDKAKKEASFSSSYSQADTEIDCAALFMGSLDQCNESADEEEGEDVEAPARIQSNSFSSSSRSVLSKSSTPSMGPVSPIRPLTKLPPASRDDGRNMTAVVRVSPTDA